MSRDPQVSSAKGGGADAGDKRAASQVPQSSPFIRPHGRYGYSAIVHRKPFTWPGGKRLAVYVGLNLEHFSFGEGHGAELCPGGPQPDVLNYAWRDYGNRVGVWRLIDLFDELSLPASVLVNSSIYHYCPEVMDAFRRAATKWWATGAPIRNGKACCPNRKSGCSSRKQPRSSRTQRGGRRQAGSVPGFRNPR